MSLAANALMTLAEAKAFLGITGSSEDLLLETAINVASDWAEQLVGRALVQQTVTNLRLRGPDGTRLALPVFPLKTSSTVTCVVSGEAQTVWRQESDGDQEDFDVVVEPASVPGSRWQPDTLYRASGWSPTSERGRWNVLLSYTGGLATVPVDLKEAALLLLQRVWREDHARLTDLVTVSSPAGGSFTFADRKLPPRAEAILRRYTLVAVA